MAIDDENVALAGALYSHETAVTNEAANEVAEFRGEWSVEISEEIATWKGQSRVPKDATLVGLDIIFHIPEVAFKAKSMEDIYGATENAADVLYDAAGTTAAHSYTFDEDTTPPELQWLVDCVMDGKHFQAFAGAGIAMSTGISFTGKEHVVHNVDLLIYSATGSLVKFLIED